MQRKTIIALLLFVLLLGLAYFVLKRPEKGERLGERPRPIPAIASGTTRLLTVTSKGATVVLKQQGSEWRMVKPVEYATDKYAVDSALEKLTKLELSDLITEMKSKHAEYEVDEKSGVRVTASDGTKVLADFYLGKTASDFTMLRPVDRDQVYQAVGTIRFVFEREPKNWRKRNIIELKQEEVRRLEVATDGAPIVLSRADEKASWKVESAPLKIEKLDESVPQNLLSTLYALSAFDFADGITPEKSGLAKPAATITVGLKTGSPLTLIIGGHKDDDFWVQRKGDPQVFVLKKYSVENLLRRPIDFRDKTILSFKAEDVISLFVDKKKDKDSVRLTPKGKDWLGNGKPIKDATKLKSALEALAALKAEGFASQTAGELGLDKPEWVLELQLKDKSKHTLTIGSQEKDGVYGVTRKGAPEIFTLRKPTLDRFLLDPKDCK